MSPADRPTYLLTLQPEPGPVPEIHRLRRCLKALLRLYGLRCLAVEQVELRPKPSENAQDARHGVGGAEDGSRAV
jgi:hypothetical protein